MATLTWNNDTSCYEAEVDEGTLYVWGDAFAEARSDGKVALAQDRHRDASDEEMERILESDEGDKIDTEVWNEIIDPTTWMPDAKVFDYNHEGYIDCGDAWIVRKVNA